MRFLLYNIRYGTGHLGTYHLPLPFSGFFRPTHKKIAEITTFIQSYQPDIIGLVEVDNGSYRSGRTCQAETIASTLGYHFLVQGKYGAHAMANHVPVMNRQANAILSRTKIIDHTFHFFEVGVKKLIIEARFHAFTVLLVHLSLKYKHRQYQLEKLYAIISHLNTPVILAGDFNTFNGSRELKLFLGATNLISANPQGIPSHPSHAPHRQLDFILHSKDLLVNSFIVPHVMLSDHAPLICDFSFR